MVGFHDEMGYGHVKFTLFFKAFFKFEGYYFRHNFRSSLITDLTLEQPGLPYPSSS